MLKCWQWQVLLHLQVLVSEESFGCTLARGKGRDSHGRVLHILETPANLSTHLLGGICVVGYHQTNSVGEREGMTQGSEDSLLELGQVQSYTDFITKKGKGKLPGKTQRNISKPEKER